MEDCAHYVVKIMDKLSVYNVVGLHDPLEKAM